MPRGTATLLLGMTVGLVGMMIYTRLREAQVEEDAQQLVDRLSQNLFDLEHGTPLES